MTHCGWPRNKSIHCQRGFKPFVFGSNNTQVQRPPQSAFECCQLYRFRPIWQYKKKVLTMPPGELKFTVAKTCEMPYNSSIQTNKRKENEKKQKQKNLRCSASQAFRVETNARWAPESTPERLRFDSNRKGCWRTKVLGCQNGKYRL